MSRIVGNAANSLTTQSAATNPTTGTGASNDLRDMDVNEFLQLMITELQNQDPLNPMDNAQMVQQMATIREIGSTNQLSETLQDFAVSQQLTTASNMLGKEIRALDDQANEVKGKVERVTVEVPSGDQASRKVKVHIGSRSIDVKNVREII
jgi:flagellar basal-body rod modification protein FlgD